MGLFSKIREATVSKTGQYFTAGKYRVKLKVVKSQESSQAGNKNFFIIETSVLESDNDVTPAGCERSQVIDLGNQMAMPNVKEFTCCASGIDPQDPESNEKVEAFWKEIVGEAISFENVCELITSEGNPLEDVEMDLECVDVETKKSKDRRKSNPDAPQEFFTKHIWAPRTV